MCWSSCSPSLYFCCCCGSQTFPNSCFGLGSDFLSDFPRGLCVYPSPTQLPGRLLRSESDSCVSAAGKLDDAPSRLHGKAHDVCSALFKDLYDLCLQIPFPAMSLICEPLVLMKFDFPLHQCCASSLCFVLSVSFALLNPTRLLRLNSSWSLFQRP